MIGSKEGDPCGYDGCPGTLEMLPPIFFEGHEGCYCYIGHPPCAWCESHEVRCTECCRLPDDVQVEWTFHLDEDSDRQMMVDGQYQYDVQPAIPTEPLTLREALESSLVSLDIQRDSCKGNNLLRIEPELHFPLNEVFEVPDEFNGHQRGTFYYRNSRGVLRGPFMNADEAGFDLCRKPNLRA